MTMFKREYFWIAFAAGQLTLVALGMARIGLLPDSTTAGKLLRIYCGITGADNTYGFFAPGVRHQERAVFRMTDETGRQWNDDLQYGQSHEANLRLGSTTNVLREVDDETAFYFMGSMADTMFKRHPSAKTVEVQIQAYAIRLPGAGNGVVPAFDFPTMAEYRQGKQPEWIDLYSLTFRTDADGKTMVVRPGENLK